MANRRRWKKKLRRFLRRLRKVKKEVWITAGGIVFALILILIAWNRPAVNPAKFQRYQKKLPCEEIEVCADSSGKTYEDYRMITDPTSRQYRLIHESLKIDRKTGFLYDRDGFLAVALGYQFGEVGSRYYVTLDTGIILPVIKTDEKDPKDASDGCAVDINGTVLEFVIDAKAALHYFGTITNGLVLDGNYNNSPYFRGKIARMERLTDGTEP